MPEHAGTRAPYNFVPFSNKVLRRYQDISELPAHDRMDKTLLSGEIHATLTADTPVFLSNGSEHFFQMPDGSFAIPGSSLRGMVRENMQILGFGLVRPGEDLEDCQIYFREVAAAGGSAAGPLKVYYQNALGVETKRTDKGKPYSVAGNVRAGYLCREGNGYVIRPVRGGYLKISRKDQAAASFRDRYAGAFPVVYQAGGDGKVKRLKASREPVDGWNSGVVLCTGRPVQGTLNHLYIFPEPDQKADPIPISKEDELSYREDLEKRFNSLKGFRYDPQFWALPEEGEKKPVFYIRYEMHTYFGMSMFLRIGYRYPLSEGLPDKQKNILRALSEDGVFLDYPHAILGFAGKKYSYRSRVSFEDFPARGRPREMEPVKTVLGEPRPSFYAGYSEKGRHYNYYDSKDGRDEYFHLRGYKQYWLKEEENIPALKEKVSSTLRPLPRGTKFQGVIRFKNLYPDELGLLLWALRLDEGCYQSIGMGKPYGYGRVKLEIDELRLFDFRALYTAGGFCGGARVEKDAGQRYINEYISRAEKELTAGPSGGKKKKKKGLRDFRELQAFFYLHSTVQENAGVSYMALSEYKNCLPLPDAAEIKKAAGERAGSQPAAAADPLAALKAKFDKMRM